MSKTDNKELEEAIKDLKKLVQLRKNKRGEIKYDTCICSTKDLDVVLQALENSISKEVIKEKKQELEKEYKECLEENSTKAFILKCQLELINKILI